MTLALKPITLPRFTHMHHFNVWLVTNEASFEMELILCQKLGKAGKFCSFEIEACRIEQPVAL